MAAHNRSKSTSFRKLCQCLSQVEHNSGTGFMKIRISGLAQRTDDPWFNIESSIDSSHETPGTDEHSKLSDVLMPHEELHEKEREDSSSEYISSHVDEDSRGSDVDSFFVSPQVVSNADEPAILTKEDSGLKRPRNGFIRFSVEHRQKISSRNSNLDNREVSRILGAKWRKMSFEQKQPYEMEFQNDLKDIREHNPEWHYGPTKRLSASNSEPLHSRLRPRATLKRKAPFSARRSNKRKWTSRKLRLRTNEQKPETETETCVRPSEPTSWVQCDFCKKWRRLSNDYIQNLPPVWLCIMHPDKAFRSCLAEEELEATMDKSIPRFIPGSERQTNYPLSFSTSSFLLLHREPSWN